MGDDERKLLNNSIVYVMSTAGVQLIGLYLVSIYTNNLTLEQFGQYSLIVSIESFVAIFATLGINSGLSRYYNEFSDKNRLKNTALTFALLWGSLFIGIIVAIAPIIASYIFYDDLNGPCYIRLLIINAVILSIISIYRSYYAIQYKARLTGLVDLLIKVLSLLWSFYFIVFLKYQVLGILQAHLLAYLMILLMLLMLDAKYIRIVCSKRELKNMLSFGLGLVPGSTSAWILNLIDRYFLKEMVNLSTVAVYSMGYKIGMMVGLVFILPFGQAFTPFKLRVYKEDDGKARFRKQFSYYNFLGWFCIIGLALYSRVVILFIAPPEYAEAYRIVPLIAISYYLFGLTNFYNLGLVIASKMLLNSGIVMVGAVVNVLLNILLIPSFGMYGAAAATIISCIVINFSMFYFGRKYFNSGLSMLSILKHIALFSSLYSIYLLGLHFLIGDNLLFELTTSTFLCLLYVVFAVILKLILYDEVITFIQSTRHFVIKRLFKR